MKLWVDKIMNTDYAVGGESKPLKDFVYSWDVLNEVILSYPERLPARTSNGSYSSAGSIQREDQGVTGRGNWTPNADDPGETLHAWGDPAFTWKDALRYGNSDEEFWDAKRAGNPWVRALGPDAVYLMFKYARLKAPDAILYINDYDTFRPNKADMIYKMVVDLNERWKSDPDNPNPNGTMLINAMGAQEHNNIEPQRTAGGNIIVGTTYEGVEHNFEKWASIPNMRLGVSELDVRVYDNGGTNTAPTIQQQIDQAKLFRHMFRTYLKYSNNANGSRFDRVTFWGHTDNGNWKSAGKPTMFDNSRPNNRAKPAYYAVQQALREYRAAHP
jgi:GH35 family endo-1,4-beta-xylanase